MTIHTNINGKQEKRLNIVICILHDFIGFHLCRQTRLGRSGGSIHRLWIKGRTDLRSHRRGVGVVVGWTLGRRQGRVVHVVVTIYGRFVTHWIVVDPISIREVGLSWVGSSRRSIVWVGIGGILVNIVVPKVLWIMSRTSKYDR